MNKRAAGLRRVRALRNNKEAMMHIDLNSRAPGATPTVGSQYRTCYLSHAPEVVRAIQAWEQQQATFYQARQRLGDVFGGVAVSFAWLQTQFIGGIRLAGGVELDRHWRRPDRWGYRTLRLRARIPANMRLIPPATIHAEHDRLLACWARHCPAPIDASEVWQRLGIHLGSVSLWGGHFFYQDGAAHISLGFDPSLEEAGQPALAWLAQAMPITSAMFDAARDRSNGAAA